MSIPVIWHISEGFWDQALPKYILEKAVPCEHFIGLEKAKPAEVGVIVIPGQHSIHDYQALRSAAANFGRVVFVVTGDEEGLFDLNQIKTPHSTIWSFAPAFYPKKYPDRVCIFGWPTGAPEMIKAAKDPWSSVRDGDWCFMGQVTHERREQCVEAVRNVPHGLLVETEGFSKGIPREEYYSILNRSKIALCPSGRNLPDTFRFAEALEAGCVPIVDDLAPIQGFPPGYWRYVLGSETLPFPLIHDWSTVPQVISFWLKGWETNARICQLWWASKKRDWIKQMRQDLLG